jgi:hypothetical protein
MVRCWFVSSVALGHLSSTDKQADLRYAVKQETMRASTRKSLAELLQKINPLLRGWGHFYRFCTGASAIFSALDHYVGDRLWRWQQQKHKGLKRKRTTIRRQPSLVRPTRKVEVLSICV